MHVTLDKTAISTDGLVINNEEIKLALFADDVICFLGDRLSYLHLFVILKFFSRFSGLNVNDDKTELFAKITTRRILS